ncbi:MAG TPA: hypothetical protein VKC66_04480 [Xanthobacteraceae bacterium]|nr:hypothetical protein [Xanthobacteraceae bacterium]
MRLPPGLISRADCAVVPIDCIRHDAVGILKRQADLAQQCHQGMKQRFNWVEVHPNTAASIAVLLEI